MGNFYVNVTTKGPEHQDVVNYLKEGNYTAYISPTLNNVTTIYDAICDTQDFGYISNFLKDISSTLGCVAIGVVNHDDDLLAYEIYENGNMHHEYDSTPGYFTDALDGPPKGGDAGYLCKVFEASDNESRVEKILRDISGGENGYLFACERHKELWEALGLPPYAIGVGYNYISEGEVPQGFAKDDLSVVNK